MSLRDLLANPRLDSINVDSVDRIAKHCEILLDKRMGGVNFRQLMRMFQSPC